jgi:hypothetical protein
MGPLDLGGSLCYGSRSAEGFPFVPRLCDAGFDALAQNLSFKFGEDGEHAGHGAPSLRSHFKSFRERNEANFQLC